MPRRLATAGELLTHRLTPSFFAEFYSGAITEKSMATLRSSVYSQRRALLLAVMHCASTSQNASRIQAGFQRSYEILSALEEHAPAVVEDVLMHPPTGVWLVRALRILMGVDADAQSHQHELHYLHSLAAAAAIRAGYSCTITVPVGHGIVSLPTVGYIELTSGVDSLFAELRNSPESAALYLTGDPEPIRFSEGSPSQGFVPAERLSANARGADLVVEIDDSNPYREFTAPEPPHRMSPAERDQWARLFDDAWDVLTSRHAAYARELSSAGVLTVAPVFSARSVAGSSSNSAFGGIALSPKTSAIALAEVLVHELQHSKLNALLELVPLRQENTEGWWYAPWRDDPRPLIGLLHGVYAFISVVEFWRDQREYVTDENERRAADFVFAHRRHQVRTAIEALKFAPELTEYGSQLVSAAAQRLTRCEAETVPVDVADAIVLMEKEHRVTWRLRHLRPDNVHIRLLVNAWHDRTIAPSPAPTTVDPSHRRIDAATRNALLKTKAVDPATFGDLVAQLADADTAFAVGDHSTAASAYISRIRSTPDDAYAWAGLAVSLEPRTSAANALLTMPETVLAVYEQLLGQDGQAPDPVALATWLGATADA
jgi:HEXXH motif-containing protein